MTKYLFCQPPTRVSVFSKLVKCLCVQTWPSKHGALAPMKFCYYATGLMELAAKGNTPSSGTRLTVLRLEIWLHMRGDTFVQSPRMGVWMSPFGGPEARKTPLKSDIAVCFIDLLASVFVKSRHAWTSLTILGNCWGCCAVRLQH